MKFPTIAACCFFLPILTHAEKGGEARKRSADEVLLLCNVNSQVSKSVSDDYAQKRHIKQRLSIQCQDSALSAKDETVSLAEYTKAIENPVRAFLATHPKINFIVLTKGIPIRIAGAPLGVGNAGSKDPEATRGSPSVDSYLAAMDYASRPGCQKVSFDTDGFIGSAYANRYWNANEPFSHAKFGGYLVTRLDAYTEADAKALVSRSLEAERHFSELFKQGKVLLDVQSPKGLGDKSSQPAPLSGTTAAREMDWSEWNADLRHAHDVLAERGIPDELDLTDAFIGHRSNLLGYFSWGSNDGKYTTEAYQSLSFAPGSFGDTAVSTSGRTFLPTQGGQSLIADLIAHGLTCSKGYVNEPMLVAVSSPTIALDRYTSGYTMAESFYAASRLLAWEDVVIGDPLCAPYFRFKKQSP